MKAHSSRATATITLFSLLPRSQEPDQGVRRIRLPAVPQEPVPGLDRSDRDQRRQRRSNLPAGAGQGSVVKDVIDGNGEKGIEPSPRRLKPTLATAVYERGGLDEISQMGRPHRGIEVAEDDGRKSADCGNLGKACEVGISSGGLAGSHWRNRVAADDLQFVAVEINHRVDQGDVGALDETYLVRGEGMATVKSHPKVVMAGNFDEVRVIGFKRGERLDPVWIDLHQEDEVRVTFREIGEDRVMGLVRSEDIE